MNKYLAFLTFLATVMFALSTLAFFGTYDPSAFPMPTEQPFITPSPYTFGIWIVIYVWLIYGSFMSWRRHPEDAAWQAGRWPLIGSMIAGSLWPWYFQTSPLVGTIIIAVMFAFAAISLFRTPNEEPIIGIYPVGLYVGWLSAATGVSLGAWLFDAQTGSNIVVSIIGLVVAAAFGIFMITRKPAAMTITIAVVWALVGLIVGNLGGNGSTLMAVLCAIGAVAIGLYGFRAWKAV